jgi:hypothetical protein
MSAFRGAITMSAVILTAILARPTRAAAIAFTHSNVPLGLTVAQFRKQFPNCRMANDSEENTNGFEPLTGYDPPFLDLLPNYQGSYLAVGAPGEQMATLGDGYFTFYTVHCRDGNDQSEYKAGTYQGKITIITKDDKESGQGAADQVIAQLRNNLSGRQGPIHKATSVLGQVFQGQGLDVFVTYSDEGNVRTIVEADNTLVAAGVDEVPVHIGYLDLALWQRYCGTVEVKLKAMSEKEQRGAEKVEKEL